MLPVLGRHHEHSSWDPGPWKSEKNVSLKKPPTLLTRAVNHVDSLRKNAWFPHWENAVFKMHWIHVAVMCKNPGITNGSNDRWDGSSQFFADPPSTCHSPMSMIWAVNKIALTKIPKFSSLMTQSQCPVLSFFFPPPPCFNPPPFSKHQVMTLSSHVVSRGGSSR